MDEGREGGREGSRGLTWAAGKPDDERVCGGFGARLEEPVEVYKEMNGDVSVWRKTGSGVWTYASLARLASSPSFTLLVIPLRSSLSSPFPPPSFQCTYSSCPCSH